MQTLKRLPRPTYNFDGFVLLFKGDPTAEASEKEQLSFDTQLMTLFKAQYGTQSSILNYLTGVMKPQIAMGGQGIAPTALAAMNTEAQDTIAQETKNAVQATQNAASAASGGSKLVGVAGSTNQAIGAVEAAGAAESARASNELAIENERVRQQNYWNSINVLSGNAAMTNPLGYAEGATSGTNAVSNASQAVTAANGPGIGQVIGGIVGGGVSALGGAFGAGAAKSIFG